MLGLRQPTEATELIDSGFAGLLRAHAENADLHLQLWSTDLRVLFATPSTPTDDVVRRIQSLARKAASEMCAAHEMLSDGRLLLAVPVSSTAGSPPGVLTALSRKSHRQDHEQAERMLRTLAMALGSQLALAQRNSGLQDELISLQAELGMLRRISARMRAPETDPQAIEFILQQGCAPVAADLALLQIPGFRQPVHCANPYVDPARLQLRERDTHDLAAQLWYSMGSWSTGPIHGDLAQVLGQPSPFPGPVQVALHPIDAERPKAGFLALLRAGRTPFGSPDLRLMRALAEQTSMALRSADLQENVGNFLMSTVKALVSAIEAKDPYTSGHSARVNLLSMLLGRDLGLSVSELEDLRWASILHDVGKIGMPESILNKRGPLSPEEFEIVKHHPWRGYEVLGHIGQLKEASQVVLFHHERIDGCGYPMGITKEAIPMAARIIAVADTFDALTSNRPYRLAWTEDEAFAEIRRVSGTQLDADVVEALSRMIPFLKENRIMFETAEQVA